MSRPAQAFGQPTLYVERPLATVVVKACDIIGTQAIPLLLAHPATLTTVTCAVTLPLEPARNLIVLVFKFAPAIGAPPSNFQL